MKRGGGDVGSRLFVARADFEVRFDPSTHDEDKQLLRSLVQYCHEKVASHTVAVEGIAKERCWTGFDYKIEHHREARDYYTILFHLPYNTVATSSLVKALEVMSSYYWEEWSLIPNWPHHRVELLVRVRSQRDHSFSETSQVIILNPAAPFLPVAPPPPRTPPTEVDDAGDSWADALARPFKKVRKAFF